MLFNSSAFGLFLLIVFTVYWALDRAPLRLQNLFLLGAGYYFYGRWDWRFLGLLLFSSLFDYAVGLGLGRTVQERRRKLLLGGSVAVNLLLLGFFKYFNFFADSLVALLTTMGVQAHAPTLRVILPVGISFYTFQSLSYAIEVYRRRVEPTRDLVAFLAYVGFFPQLVAGPIERPYNLLPQFLSKRTFDPVVAADGLRQMLWGFFKKMVVADALAGPVEYIFSHSSTLSPGVLWLGAFLFAVQIYGDFSGYSSIAIGCAALFGFRLSPNFSCPYFSRSIGEFWRRWHISLSSWFRDYVFIPLGGSRTDAWRRARNILLTFMVSGLWHGARWTFVIWGLIHGVCYLVSTRKPVREGEEPRRLFPTPGEAGGILTTFAVTTVAWVFFRADTLESATRYLMAAVGHHAGNGSLPPTVPLTSVLLVCGALFGVEWVMRGRRHALDLSGWARPLRWCAYYAILMVLLLFGSFEHASFIYFQF